MYYNLRYSIILFVSMSNITVCQVTHAVTLGAALCILLLIARDADNVLVTWYETLVADWLPTFLAAEALLVPLFTHVFKLLHPWCTHTHKSSLYIHQC